MLENRFVLKHDLQNPIVVMWLRATWIGDHLVILIQNGHKTRIIRLLQIAKSRPTHPCIQILSVDHRSTHIGTW